MNFGTRHSDLMQENEFEKPSANGNHFLFKLNITISNIS